MLDTDPQRFAYSLDLTSIFWFQSVMHILNIVPGHLPDTWPSHPTARTCNRRLTISLRVHQWWHWHLMVPIYIYIYQLPTLTYNAFTGRLCDTFSDDNDTLAVHILWLKTRVVAWQQSNCCRPVLHLSTITYWMMAQLSVADRQRSPATMHMYLLSHSADDEFIDSC